MKTIFKIVVGLGIMTACFNASRAALTDYQFQDAVHEALLFNPRATAEGITDTVMKLASEHGIPLTEDGIEVRLVGQDVRVQMSYTESVMLIPGVFSKDWNFTPSASTKILPGTGR
jgi:hypothetical protein